MIFTLHLIQLLPNLMVPTRFGITESPQMVPGKATDQGVVKICARDLNASISRLSVWGSWLRSGVQPENDVLALPAIGNTIQQTMRVVDGLPRHNA